MNTSTLKINAVEVNCMPIQYTCYGLGSCIGLFVTDRFRQISGGAHIAMPSPSGSHQYPDACQIMDELVRGLREKGSDLTGLRAKITGGARVYESALDIGAQNIKVVLQYLTDKRIFLASADLGGRIARTARFNSMTGVLQISTSDRKMYTI